MSEYYFDWQCNQIQVGQELCIIKTSDNQFEPIGWMHNTSDGCYIEPLKSEGVDQSNECWQIEHTFKVGEDFRCVIDYSGIKINTHLASIVSLMQGNQILAIKGLSDIKHQ